MQQYPNGSNVIINGDTPGVVVGWAEGASADTGDDLYAVRHMHPNALLGFQVENGVKRPVLGPGEVTSWHPVSVIEVAP